VAGSLDPTNAPGATMHTLDDVYASLYGTVTAAKIGLNNTNLPGPTMRTIEDLYQLAVAITNGGRPVGIARTGVVTSHATGDDGYYRKGRPWPNPVFTVGTGSSSNCVTDNRTGLMWVRNPSETPRVWSDALAYCENLDGSNGRGGYTDWRMPNILEMFTLYDFSGQNINTIGNPTTLPVGHPFLGWVPQGVSVWSSTSMPWGPTTHCWVISTAEAITTFAQGKSATNCYVWAVRGGN